MTQKGLEVLTGVIEKFGSEVVRQVVTAPDKAVNEDYYNGIKAVCSQHKISCADRQTPILSDGYAFAIGWRWLIKEQDKLIILHDSLLPKYRGFAPLVNALINGERKIGVTALFASGEYDKGQIIVQRKIEIEYPIKISAAIEAVSLLYREIANEIIERIVHKEIIVGETQDESAATYSLWRDEKDYQIDWNKDSEYIKRFVDSVGFPYNGALTGIENKWYRVLNVELAEDVSIVRRDVGKVIFLQDGEPTVVCGNGLLRITEMIDDESKQSSLPFKKFRVRFI